APFSRTEPNRKRMPQKLHTKNCTRAIPPSAMHKKNGFTFCCSFYQYSTRRSSTKCSLQRTGTDCKEQALRNSNEQRCAEQHDRRSAHHHSATWRGTMKRLNTGHRPDGLHQAGCDYCSAALSILNPHYHYHYRHHYYHYLLRHPQLHSKSGFGG